MSEFHYRYCVERHEDCLPERRQMYLDRGIDPDNNWQLIWSFKEASDAYGQYLNELDQAPDIWHFRVLDSETGEVLYGEKENVCE